MGLFRDLLEATGMDAAFDGAVAKVKRFWNEDFAEASMAIFAWFAAADGVIADEEIDTVMTFISTHEKLKPFDTKDLQTRFQRFAKDVQSGDMFAMRNIKAAIAKFADDREKALTLLEFGMILAKSDDDFDISEKKVALQVCGILKVEKEAVFTPDELAELA